MSEPCRGFRGGADVFFSFEIQLFVADFSVVFPVVQAFALFFLQHFLQFFVQSLALLLSLAVAQDHLPVPVASR